MAQEKSAWSEREEGVEEEEEAHMVGQVFQESSALGLAHCCEKKRQGRNELLVTCPYLPRCASP